jgi:hypothetical protein
MYIRFAVCVATKGQRGIAVCPFFSFKLKSPACLQQASEQFRLFDIASESLRSTACLANVSASSTTSRAPLGLTHARRGAYTEPERKACGVGPCKPNLLDVRLELSLHPGEVRTKMGAQEILISL